MTFKEMIAATGPEYMLRQLAEECCELGHAALKTVCAIYGETPVSLGEAHEMLIEETADVLVMINILKAGFFTVVENYDIEQAYARKCDRFSDRIDMEFANKDPAT